MAALLFRYGVLCGALLASSSLVHAQIGVTLCACQPSVYTFELNFSAICDVSTIDSRPGVRGADCFARGIGLYADETFDFVPVQVTTVSIIELNRQFQVLAQTPYADSFQDGDKVTYTSILGTPEGVAAVTPENIPGGLQIDIVGINALEQPITNVWIILFDNDCGIFPVLEKGDQIGWTIIEDIRLPYQSICPIADSVAPTPGPKSPTTSHPSSEPSSEPSNAPVEAVLSMDEPTLHPSEHPSEAPIDEAPVCIKGKAGKGKSGKGKSGKGNSGKSGSGKSGSGKSGSGKSGNGKSGGNGYHDGYTPVSSQASIRDFYRFGVSALSAGSHPVDRYSDDYYSESGDSGKGKGSSAAKSGSDDDDDEECLPPKKKKATKISSQKKLKKKGKGKSGKAKSESGKAGKGKAGKGYSDDDEDSDLYSGKGKSGKGDSMTNTSSGKGKGGKAGSKYDSSSAKISKKLEERNPARTSNAKLAKITYEVSLPKTKTFKKETAAPSISTSQPTAPTPAPTKVTTSAPSIPTEMLNMHLLQSRISHWLHEHSDQTADGDLDRRSLRQ